MRKAKTGTRNWIAGTIKRPGALHRKLGVAAGQDIPPALIREAKAHPERFVKGRAAQVRLEREANEALELEGFKRKGNPDELESILASAWRNGHRTSFRHVRMLSRAQVTRLSERPGGYLIPLGKPEFELRRGDMVLTGSGVNEDRVFTIIDMARFKGIGRNDVERKGNPHERKAVADFGPDKGVHVTFIADTKWEVHGRSPSGEYFGSKYFQSLAQAEAFAEKVVKDGLRTLDYGKERRRKGNPVSSHPFAYEVRAHGAAVDTYGNHDLLHTVYSDNAQDAKKGAEEWRRKYNSKHAAENRRLGITVRIVRAGERKGNPASDDDGDTDARALYQGFHGEPSAETITAHGTSDIPRVVTALGELTEMTLASGSVLSFDGKGFLLTSNPAGTQLYIVGAPASFTSDDLGEFDTTKDLIDLGPVKYIVYRTEKGFDKFKSYEYKHKLGEESGDRPTLIYDRRNHRLLLAGGNYEVRPEGIVD